MEFGKGNRDSVGTTDSTASEDDPPPPLPVKTREADYCNLPSEGPLDHCPTSPVNSIGNPLSPKLKSKIPAPLEGAESHVKPPPPPPKPKRPPPHGLTKIFIPTNDSQDPPPDSSAAWSTAIYCVLLVAWRRVKSIDRARKAILVISIPPRRFSSMNQGIRTK